MLDVSTKGQDFEYYSGIWVDLAQGDKNILRCWDILASLLYILASPVYYFTCHYDNQLCGFQHTSCRCNLTITYLMPSLYASQLLGWDLPVNTTIRPSLMPIYLQSESMND